MAFGDYETRKSFELINDFELDKHNVLITSVTQIPQFILLFTWFTTQEILFP